MKPAWVSYCLKQARIVFFRYPAPKIVKCRISETPKKIILRQNIRPFFASEFGKRYSANVSLINALMNGFAIDWGKVQ
jgi:hypothetical protein